MIRRCSAIAAILVVGCGGGGGAAPDAAEVDGAPPGVCGDGVCSGDETATRCCADCGICSDDAVVTIETGAPGGAPGGRITPGGMAASYSSFAGGPFVEMA